MKDGNLLAQPFDAERAQITGETIPIASGIPFLGFSVSDSGVLVYFKNTLSELTWFDRSGLSLGTVGEPGVYRDIDMSPDGEHIALERSEPEWNFPDIWQFDLSRGVYSRLTSDSGWDYVPRWSPDGERLAFSSNRQGHGIYQVLSSGTPQPELLFDSAISVVFTQDWSPDGRYIAFASDQMESDLMVLPLFGEGEPIPFLDSSFDENDGRFSPDGRFFAYESNESGRYEIYVTTFPEPDQRWQISREGGTQPLWRSDGEELFYVSAEGKLMAVMAKTVSGFEDSLPEELLELPIVPGYTHRRGYAVAADGKRFLVITPVGGAALAPVTVILNWFEELKRLVPTDN